MLPTVWASSSWEDRSTERADILLGASGTIEAAYSRESETEDKRYYYRYGWLGVLEDHYERRCSRP